MNVDGQAVATVDRDSWTTPPDFWAAVNGRFDFTLDACATAFNSKCQMYWSPEVDALSFEWSKMAGFHRTIWCNPGFSNLTPWMLRAAGAARGNCTVCVLSHASHTARWAQYALEHATELWLVCPRIQFVAPEGIKQTSNNRDSMLWIFTPWGNQGKAAIKHWNWQLELEAK